MNLRSRVLTRWISFGEITRSSCTREGTCIPPSKSHSAMSEHAALPKEHSFRIGEMPLAPERSTAPQMCKATSAERTLVARRGNRKGALGGAVPRFGNVHGITEGDHCTNAESRFTVEERVFRDLGTRRRSEERPFRDGKTFILACGVNLRARKSPRHVGDWSCRIRAAHHGRPPIVREWRDVRSTSGVLTFTQRCDLVTTC